MTKLLDVEGIGAVYAEKLQAGGISTTETLLEKGATPKGRVELSDKTGISPALILRWVNHVDLFRIKGVAGQYAELLEAAGVDTVPELAQRNAASLHQKLAATNQQRKCVRQLPTRTQVESWVEQAKKLPRLITY